jgi:hypothetical protein
VQEDKGHRRVAEGVKMKSGGISKEMAKQVMDNLGIKKTNAENLRCALVEGEIENGDISPYTLPETEAPDICAPNHSFILIIERSQYSFDHE